MALISRLLATRRARASRFWCALSLGRRPSRPENRYTVLPWEVAAEYGAVLEALAVEHQLSGPTEEHLVEEIAGILWRKRRLCLAEAAAICRGLPTALSASRWTAEKAVAHLRGVRHGGGAGRGRPGHLRGHGERLGRACGGRGPNALGN